VELRAFTFSGEGTREMGDTIALSSVATALIFTLAMGVRSVFAIPNVVTDQSDYPTYSIVTISGTFLPFTIGVSK
jgi:hypothetical protein